MYEYLFTLLAEQLFFRPLVVFLIACGLVIVAVCISDLTAPAQPVTNEEGESK